MLSPILFLLSATAGATAAPIAAWHARLPSPPDGSIQNQSPYHWSCSAIRFELHSCSSLWRAVLWDWYNRSWSLGVDFLFSDSDRGNGLVEHVHNHLVQMDALLSTILFKWTPYCYNLRHHGTRCELLYQWNWQWNLNYMTTKTTKHDEWNRQWNLNYTTTKTTKQWLSSQLYSL
jgi:hypothetical protein